MNDEIQSSLCKIKHKTFRRKFLWGMELAVALALCASVWLAFAG